MYDLLSKNSQKLQDITNKLVRRSMVDACKSWHRYSVDQKKMLIDAEIKDYRQKRSNLRARLNVEIDQLVTVHLTALKSMKDKIRKNESTIAKEFPKKIST